MTCNDIIEEYRNLVGCFPACVNGHVHVAIVDGHTARLILAGKKQIETRFSASRQAPYARIRKGDTILIKKSGGPVVGIAQAERVRFYAGLNAQKINTLRDNFSDLIQARSAFWNQKKTAKYATLIYLHHVRRTEPFWLAKRGRSGWRVYESSSELEVLTQRVLRESADSTVNDPHSA